MVPCRHVLSVTMLKVAVERFPLKQSCIYELHPSIDSERINQFMNFKLRRFVSDP